MTIEKIDAAGVRTLAANATKNYRLVNVWATWCGPCVQELPELVTMNRMYRRRPFEMILINMNGVDDSEQVLAVPRSAMRRVAIYILLLTITMPWPMPWIRNGRAPCPTPF